MSTASVDARGAKCPYPVIELARAAADAGPDSTVELLCDDPVALSDVPAWCRMRGAQLVAVEDLGDHWRFRVLTGPAEHR
ncbi:MAG: sulfurtransferase TusA family protein [Candidatus Nanopelagicales bacterium]